MKHKYLALFLVCIMLFSFSGLSGGTAVSHAATSEFAGGTGTSENPWQIATADQLNNVRNYQGSTHTDKHFLLMNDIDLTSYVSFGGDGYNDGKGWLPIGYAPPDNLNNYTNAFCGSFDGGGHSISGLFINRQPAVFYDYEACGLFGVVVDAELSNLTLSGQVTGNQMAGGLAGYAVRTTMNNISFIGDVTNNYSYLGGLIGVARESTITDCATAGTVSTTSSSVYTGGLVGMGTDTIMTNCHSSASVSGYYSTGGLAGGIDTASSIITSTATGDVTGTNSEIGGLVGYIENSSVSQSFASGNVSGSTRVGGLCGMNTGSTVTNAYATGSVTGTNEVGGLVGCNSGGTLTNAYAVGYVNSTGASTGGLVGEFSVVIPVYTSFYDTQTTGQSTDNTLYDFKGIPKTTAEMKQESTFTGWNFVNVWGIEENVTYPYLLTETVVPTTYTVTYDGNGSTGGTVPLDSNSYLTGDTVTVLGNTGSLEKTGYTFAGWNTVDNGSGTSYNADDTFKITDNTILYAMWDAAMLAVLDQSQTDTTDKAGIFQYNWTAIGQDFTAGKTGNLTKISLYLSTPYYGFPGYNADITLEVRTQYNAGTVLATTTSYFSSSEGGTWVDFDFVSPVPVTAGTKYTFRCIPTASTALAIHHSSTDVYPGQAFYSLSGGSYSYFQADWSFKTYVYESAPTYALTMAAAPAGSGTATDTSGGSPYASGTAVNISATPSSGYSFVNWTDSPADGTFGSTTSATTTYTMPAQAETVTANFEANTYTVTFASQGGSAPEPGSKTVTYASAYGTLPEVTQSGYTFNGWYTEATGGTEVTSTTMVTTADNHTLYAQWEAIPPTMFTVTFNGNGGTPSSDSLQVEDGNTVETLPTAIWEGYTFEGWNTAANGSGTAFTTETTVTGDITVYAQWEAIPPTTYTVAFDGNGGTPATQARTVEDGSTVETLPTVTWDGYTLTGWNTAANGSGTAFTTETTVTGDITVYAQWEAIPSGYFNVSVSANPTVGGTVTGGGNYETGARVKVSAIAKENYAFIHWTEGSTVVCKGATYNFRMGTESRNLVAHFEPTVPATAWLVTTSAKPSEGGSVSGGGLFAEGDPVCVNAIANSGYRFINWTEGLIEVSTDAAYSFTMGTKERSLTANFLAEGTGWPKMIKLSVTDITDTSVILQLSQSVPDAEYYLVYTGDLLYRTFNATSFAAMEIDMLEPFTFYTFTVQALYPDYIETSDGPYVKVKTKR